MARLLKKYQKGDYSPGRSLLIIGLWYITSILFFRNPFVISSSFKVLILKVFGAKIGRGVCIKPNVTIKFPWKLKIGNHSWIGERVWIDNHHLVEIGSNVCISQRAMVLCGNHNYTSPFFDLITQPVYIGDGAWIGAGAMICPGTMMHKGAILTVGSVSKKILLEYTVYRGNPAKAIRQYSFNSSHQCHVKT